MKARRILRQHYQHIVIHDFLKRVCDPAIVDGILQNGNQVYDPPQGAFFLPLEYAVAAYRFGHTMVRDEYDFNLNFNTTEPDAFPASLALLFTFTALSGELGRFTDTLPDNWIVQWENLVDGGAAGRDGAPDRHHAGRTGAVPAAQPDRADRAGVGAAASPCATCCGATCCACRPGRRWRGRWGSRR